MALRVGLVGSVKEVSGLLAVSTEMSFRGCFGLDVAGRGCGRYRLWGLFLLSKGGAGSTKKKLNFFLPAGN